jgi:uncharacterized membrane protein YjjP (DUF1212 family)
MESWKITFMVFIIVGFFAALSTGQAALLIIPFIMSIVLIISGLRSKPKQQQTYSTTET